MEQILKELAENNNIRTNLSSLRKEIKDEQKKAYVLDQVQKQETLFLDFLKFDLNTKLNFYETVRYFVLSLIELVHHIQY